MMGLDAAAGAAEKQHFLVGAEDLAQPGEHIRVERAVVRPAMVDDGLRDRRQHLGRRGRRPRCHQVALLGHDPRVAFGAAGASGLRQGRTWVDRRAAQPDLEMEVRPGRVAGRADRAEP